MPNSAIYLASAPQKRPGTVSTLPRRRQRCRTSYSLHEHAYVYYVKTFRTIRFKSRWCLFRSEHCVVCVFAGPLNMLNHSLMGHCECRPEPTPEPNRVFHVRAPAQLAHKRTSARARARAQPSRISASVYNLMHIW